MPHSGGTAAAKPPAGMLCCPQPGTALHCVPRFPHSQTPLWDLPPTLHIHPSIHRPAAHFPALSRGNLSQTTVQHSLGNALKAGKALWPIPVQCCSSPKHSPSFCFCLQTCSPHGVGCGRVGHGALLNDAFAFGPTSSAASWLLSRERRSWVARMGRTLGRDPLQRR